MTSAEEIEKKIAEVILDYLEKINKGPCLLPKVGKYGVSSHEFNWCACEMTQLADHMAHFGMSLNSMGRCHTEGHSDQIENLQEALRHNKEAHDVYTEMSKELELERERSAKLVAALKKIDSDCECGWSTYVHHVASEALAEYKGEG